MLGDFIVNHQIHGYFVLPLLKGQMSHQLIGAFEDLNFPTEQFVSPPGPEGLFGARPGGL